MSDELLRLAAECEAANGPDRELDVAISGALGLIPKNTERCGSEAVWASDTGFRWHCPSLTGSLDVAMSLIPTQRFVAELNQADFGGEWYALLRTHDCAKEDGLAPTVPLALTAACLRAIARLRMEVE